MGDVAMTVPVLKELLEQNPSLKVTMVSRPLFAPFFNNIERLNFFPADVDKTYKGFFGLRQLVRDLKKTENFSAIADLHNVLRTKVLRVFMRGSGAQAAKIGKGRTAKRKLTRRRGKRLKQLKRTSERYADVFRELGLNLELSHRPPNSKVPLDSVIREIVGAKKHNFIGFAPFAKHKAKQLPLEKTVELIERLTELPASKVILFGDKNVERKKLERIESQNSKAISIAGKLPLSSELNLINHLDVMISMDSANMHLASISGTPVVSVWGGTHPYAGFLGYGQDMADVVQDDIACRPCSVFGDKPCYRGDNACMERININDILIKVSKHLTNKI